MRYAFLDFLACQACHSQLACFTARERSAPIPAGPYNPGARISAGPGLGPLPEASAHEGTGCAARRRTFAQFSTPAADQKRNFEVEIVSGVLLCAACGRWYPIVGELPEILPDHLRTFDTDAATIRDTAAMMPSALADAALAFRPSSVASDDGARYKRAEMSIREKVQEAGFFGPGYSSPFNPWDPEFTLHLVSLFGIVQRVLELKKGEALLDSGCGYAWTTEWFHRAGVPVVGVDITRTYLDIALERLGPSRPHLVVGDVEHLPLRNDTFDAVLAYESFHHLPDRRRAMAAYDRVLGPGGRVVLAEPGGAHETERVAMDVMQKYGILERGMEIDDVHAYAAGTSLKRVEQIFLARATAEDLGARLDPEFLTRRNVVVEDHLFKLTKRGVAVGPVRLQARRRMWPLVKAHVKAALLRVGLD